MSDQDIIDTLKAHARRVDYNHPAYGKCRCGVDPDDLPDEETHADHLLAALRGAGYEIVTTEEAKLISLENQPPSAPVAAEADQ